MAAPIPAQTDDRYRSAKDKEEREKEEAEFQKRLDAMKLEELLESQRQMQEKEAKATAAIRAVREGDLSALAPYTRPQTEEKVTINAEDTQHIRAATSEGHLRNEATIWGDIKEGSDPAHELEKAKKWLKDAFPTLHTEALIVKDTHGRSYIAALGVSTEEIDAVATVRSEAKKAAKRAGEIDTRIHTKINQEPQNGTPDHEVVAPLTTPSQRDKSRSSGTRAVSSPAG